MVQNFKGKAALPNPGGLLCLRRGDRFFRYVRPAPLGSLVQRKLAAVRLTEGWIRSFLHCGRYLQPPVTAQSAVPPPLTQGRHRRTAIFSPCGHSTVWRCLLLKGDGLKSAQQISCKRKTPLPERTNRQGRFHRRNGVGKRNYHVAWGRNCVPVSGRRGSCAVTKIPACYLTVPII